MSIGICVCRCFNAYKTKKRPSFPRASSKQYLVLYIITRIHVLGKSYLIAAVDALVSCKSTRCISVACKDCTRSRRRTMIY